MSSPPMLPNKMGSQNQHYYNNHYGGGYSPTTQYNNNPTGTSYPPSSPTTNSSMGSPGPGGFSCVNLNNNNQQHQYNPGKQPGYPLYNGANYEQSQSEQQYPYLQTPPQQPCYPPFPQQQLPQQPCYPPFPQQQPPPTMGPGGFVLPSMNPNNNAYPPQQSFEQPFPMGTPQFPSAQYPPPRFY